MVGAVRADGGIAGPGGAVSARAYLDALAPILAGVGEQAGGPVGEAADLMVASLRAGGVVQAFGSGHSEALAMEFAGRAGGLVPTNRIALRDLVTLGGEPPEVLADPHLERDPQVARRLYDLAAVSPADVFVVGSNSGVNGSVVELAQLVRQRGHRLVAITSFAQTAALNSRHPSGTKLIDHADVALDNGAPYGDALLPLPGGGTVCAVSSITGALLAQLVVAEVVRRLVEAGQAPPVYLSANVPGGDDHNRILEARYAGRIRRTA
jgi:uncharacterized phosphosugar-binding protein